jgi:hypothetical protein
MSFSLPINEFLWPVAAAVAAAFLIFVFKRIFGIKPEPPVVVVLPSVQGTEQRPLEGGAKTIPDARPIAPVEKHQEDRDEDEELTPLTAKYLEFWTQLQNYAKKKEASINFHAPRGRLYTFSAAGKTGIQICYQIHNDEKLLSVELWIQNNMVLYNRLFEQKEAIEQELGEKADWEPLPHRIGSYIKISFYGDLWSESEWNTYFDRMLELGEKMRTVFPKYW